MDNPLKKIAEEWKKATPREKFMIVGAAASIVAIALYLHHKTSSSAPGTGVAGLPSNLSPASTGSPGTTGTTGVPGSSPGSTDTGSFSTPAPFYNAAPPGAVTTPTYNAPSTLTPGNSAQAGANLANRLLTQRQAMSARSTVAGTNVANKVLATQQPGAQVARNALAAQGTAVSQQAGTQVAKSVTQGVVSSYRPFQPNVTTQVYAAARHAPAVVPISSQQVVRPGQKAVG